MKEIEIEDDIVLAKFLNYMQISLYHVRLNYYRKLNRINEKESSLNEYTESGEDMYYTDEITNVEILSKKELYLLNSHYNHGLSYEEISKITNEKISTLKQRRNRAIEKLKRHREDKKYGN